jgi:signal transduction histidine kinase
MRLPDYLARAGGEFMRSVRARLTVVNILFIAALLAAVGVAVHVQVRNVLLGGLDSQLRTLTTGVTVDPALTLPDPIHRSGSIGADIRGSERTVQIFRNDRSSVRLDASQPMPQLIPVPLDGNPLGRNITDLTGYQIASEGHETTRNHRDGTSWRRTLSKPVFKGGNVVAVVQASHDLAPVTQELATLDTALITLVPLALGLAALGGWALVGGAMGPLRTLSESANRLGSDPRGSLLPVEGKDEFSHLAATFNGALLAQRRAMSQLERFTGDAGHELRTPLAAVKGATSYLLHVGKLSAEDRPFAEAIDRSTDRMTRLIDDLLVLARRDAGQAIRLERAVSVGEILDESLEELGRCGCGPLVRDVPADLRLDCDPDALRRILVNLLSNAFAYARSEVRVTAAEIEEDVVIGVQDDGDGIPAEHLARLGERFYRPDQSRARPTGGTGLGLAIVKALCEAHRGCLKLESRPGRGTVATVVLPLRELRII